MTWREDPEFRGTERHYADAMERAKRAREAGTAMPALVPEAEALLYAVLEIGRWRASMRYPADPPEWALLACADHHDRATLRLAPAVRTTQGPRVPDLQGDAEIVEWVARRRFRDGGREGAPSIQALIRHRLAALGADEGSDAFDSAVRRLQRGYGPESKAEDGGLVGWQASRVARLYNAGMAAAQRAGRTSGDFNADFFGED